MPTTAATTTGTWNGAVCTTCGARYLGVHRCSREDLQRRIDELQSLLGCPGCGSQIAGAHFCPGPRDEQPSLSERIRRAQGQTQTSDHDYTSGCPCRPENGGSGICGCIMGGITVTC